MPDASSFDPEPDSHRLAGRTLIVTGAASGIGLAIAERAIREGAQVALLDRDAEGVQAAATKMGSSAVAVVTDVSVESSVAAGLDTAQARLGPIDGVVNSAGTVRFGDVTTISQSDFELCMAANVTGTYLVARYAIPALRGGRGSIVNIASVAGLVGIPGAAAYCAAKGAVIALTRAMSADHAGDGVRVNAICPGTIHTPLIEPMLRQRGDGDLQRGLDVTSAKYPIGRLGAPDEIAAVATFLLSDDSSFMTGSVVVADGGMTAI